MAVCQMTCILKSQCFVIKISCSLVVTQCSPILRINHYDPTVISVLYVQIFIYSVACPAGKYGESCNQTCSADCVNGRCNPVNGDCDCQSGWEGPSCDIG